MTVLAEPPVLMQSGLDVVRLRTLLEHVAVLGAVAFVALPVAHASGGQDSGWAAAAAVSLAAALIFARPWKHLSSTVLVMAALVTGLALVVLATTGVGRRGAVAAMAYGLGAGLLVTVASYARTPGRRGAIAAVVCAGGVAQFAWALVPWWGRGDPSAAMVGTYYWHNQYAAALVAPGILGLAMVLENKEPWRGAGWVAAPLAFAGVLLSSSRAAMGCLIAGWVSVAVIGWLRTSRRGTFSLRVVAATLLSLSVALALPGPPLFSQRVSPLSATQDRAASGETLQSNALYRTDFWREAMAVTQAYPLTGAGYGRLGAEARALVPTSWPKSALAHSGPLQAFADGGVPLGVALLLGLAGVAFTLLRRLWRPGPSSRVDQLTVTGGAVAALALLAHSSVDFDWAYPVLAATFGIVAGLALGNRASRPSPGRTSLVPVAASLALAVLLVVGIWVSWGEPFRINVAMTTVQGDTR